MSHTWDLSVLFENFERLEEFCRDLLDAAKDFEKKHKGKLEKSKDFHKSLQEYEEVLEGIGRVMTYVFLHFASDTKKGAIYAEYEMKTHEIESHVLFFELEFCALDTETQKDLMEEAGQYGYYLEKLLLKKSHQLSLEEEKVLLQVSPVGVDAFARLFDEFFSTLKIPYQEGEKREEEILALLHSSNREERKEAQKCFSKELKKSRMLLGYIFNMVRKDLQIQSKMRNYPNKEAFRHQSNHISQKSVDSLIDVVNGNMKLVHKYYKHKSQILGYKLKDYDRYAPILNQEFSLDYAEGVGMVLACFEDFSPKFYKIAKRACEGGWVDSHPRDAKRGGAFSHGAVPSAHPFVLLNYTGNYRDVFTIAHEFGHMVHQELSKKQGYLNMDTPLTTAETASVFAEMLLFDSVKKTLSRDQLLGIYASKLEDIFSTMFRQVVMTNFERAIHASDRELKAEELDEMWMEENQKMFGKSLKLTKNYAMWWSYIPHFVHSPFYCYAYSYGQLLVLALFGLYKKQGQSFVGVYEEFLSSGGSKSPRELVSAFGFDIEDPKFWNIGMKEVKKMLKEFEELL
ncbi:M3 family oligoendopeptidase [Helicobacter mustelae]|uniref:Peptidase (M3 family) n=1 Tax=Helicobacter mustelae (strain ATCC 43772 / CCUG 25715 / CIP 103759 / LMG 18044 / NCTC 12198 / R85-136P) TaxID=679897 RepID=D3UHY2_HELM1|nr:M3 family oligoendopeptidase [Helicobacter mustelae]CBG40105.1 peptidase (M3 family) [Helicobacter mustelae 12198]SQH71619.1 M3 family peptidase [Helicobacter mustelae]